MNESTPSLHSTEKYFPHSISKRHRKDIRKWSKDIHDVYGTLTVLFFRIGGLQTNSRVQMTFYMFEALKAIILHCSFNARSWASFLSSKVLSFTFSSISFWTSASFCIFSPSNWVVFPTSLCSRERKKKIMHLRHVTLILDENKPSVWTLYLKLIINIMEMHERYCLYVA